MSCHSVCFGVFGFLSASCVASLWLHCTNELTVFFLFFFFFIFPDLCFVNYFHGNISLNTSRKVGFTLHSDLLQVLLCIHKYAQHSWSGCISSNTCPRFTRQDQVEHSTHCSASWSLAADAIWLAEKGYFFAHFNASQQNEWVSIIPVSLLWIGIWILAKAVSSCRWEREVLHTFTSVLNWSVVLKQQWDNTFSWRSLRYQFSTREVPGLVWSQRLA